VAAKVTSAVSELNGALEGVTGTALRDALEGAIDRLRDHGIRGLHVDTDGERMTVAVARDELIASLDAMVDEVDLEKVLSPVLEALESAVAAAAGWDASAPAVQTVHLAATSGAQLMADQTASSLLFARSSLQPQDSVETKQKSAMKAYGGTN
jgi:hypothetical protein